MGSFEVQINPTKTLAREESDSKTHFDCVWKLKRRARSSFWTACFEKIYFVTPEISYIYIIYIYKALTLSCKKTHTRVWGITIFRFSLRLSTIPRKPTQKLQLPDVFLRHPTAWLHHSSAARWPGRNINFKTKAGHQDVSNSEAPHRLLDENWHLWKRVRNGTDSYKLCHSNLIFWREIHLTKFWKFSRFPSHWKGHTQSCRLAKGG